MNEIKFKKGDKVKLKYPNNIDGYIDYDDVWKKWWYDNENTIFSIYYDSSYYYNLTYPNGKIVMSPAYKKYKVALSDDELELYTNTIPFPDDLFEL